MPVWVWLVFSLAVARTAGLVSQDEILRPARTWLINHLPRHRASVAVEYLATCPWCSSPWIAAAVVPAAWHWGDEGWLLGPALVLAMSQIAGMVSNLGRPATTDEADEGPSEAAAVTR